MRSVLSTGLWRRFRRRCRCRGDPTGRHRGMRCPRRRHRRWCPPRRLARCRSCRCHPGHRSCPYPGQVSVHPRLCRHRCRRPSDRRTGCRCPDLRTRCRHHVSTVSSSSWPHRKSTPRSPRSRALGCPEQQTHPPATRASPAAEGTACLRERRVQRSADNPDRTGNVECAYGLLILALPRILCSWEPRLEAGASSGRGCRCSIGDRWLGTTTTSRRSWSLVGDGWFGRLCSWAARAARRRTLFSQR